MYGGYISSDKLKSVETGSFFPDQHNYPEVGYSLVSQRLAELGLNQFLSDRLVKAGYNPTEYQGAITFSMTLSSAINNNDPIVIFYEQCRLQALNDPTERLLIALVKNGSGEVQTVIHKKSSDSSPRIIDVAMASSPLDLSSAGRLPGKESFL
jgi:hypothetical protein